MNGFWHTINRFANNINVGDHFWLSQNDIGIEKDCDIPKFLKFYVVKKYPHVVLLEKKCRNGSIHRQCISYVNLYFSQNKGMR